jgi:hypothetical protein
VYPQLAVALMLSTLCFKASLRVSIEHVLQHADHLQAMQCSAAARHPRPND